MATFDTLRTPDYSPLLVHFTKQRKMMEPARIDDAHPLAAHRESTAKEKLVSILTSRTVYASPMPWTPGDPIAVCFTECVWDALVRHADRYSRYGVVFQKRLIFDRGGAPALYLRGDYLKDHGADIPADLRPLVVPFDPDAVLSKVRQDWLHEREWRLPASLEFDYADIEYVIVDSIQDAIEIGGHVGGQHIPEQKFICMDVYQTIKTAWADK
jgi:hypothetical protein